MCNFSFDKEFFHNRAGKGKGREIYAPIEPDGEINEIKDLKAIISAKFSIHAQGHYSTRNHAFTQCDMEHAQFPYS